VRYFDHPEVSLVAKHRYAHQAGQHNGSDDQAAVVRFQPARQLLDGKHHPSQRRIKGSGNSRCAAGHQQGVHIHPGFSVQPAM